MKRNEIYHEMQSHSILMAKPFFSRLQAMPLSELYIRWLGIRALADVFKPGNRPVWMAANFGDPTTLSRGRQEKQRLDFERIQFQTRQDEQKRRQRLQEIAEETDRRKLRYWKNCPDKKHLIENGLTKYDSFYQRRVRKHFLNGVFDLETMPDDQVLLWFHGIIPGDDIHPIPFFPVKSIYAS